MPAMCKLSARLGLLGWSGPLVFPMWFISSFTYLLVLLYLYLPRAYLLMCSFNPLFCNDLLLISLGFSSWWSVIHAFIYLLADNLGFLLLYWWLAYIYPLNSHLSIHLTHPSLIPLIIPLSIYPYRHPSLHLKPSFQAPGGLWMDRSR